MSTRSIDTLTDNNPNILKGHKKLAAIAAIGMLALSGCTDKEEVSAAPEKPAVSVEHTKTPDSGTTAEETPKEPEQAAYIPLEEREPIKVSNEELAEMERQETPEHLLVYENMTLEEYLANTTIEERLTYSSWLNRDHDYIDAQFYKGSDKNPKYLRANIINEESPAHDIMIESGSHVYYSRVSHFGGLIYPDEENKKSLASAFIDLEQPYYQYWAGVADNDELVPTPGLLTSSLLNEDYGYGNPDRIVSEGPLLSYEGPSGKSYPSREITYTNLDGRVDTHRYALVDYVDYEGNEQRTYVLVEPVE